MKYYMRNKTRQWSFGFGDASPFPIGKRCLTYNLPQINKIIIVLLGNGKVPNAFRDIVICLKGGTLQCINECHPSYLLLHYVLFFSFGGLKWYSNIPHVIICVWQTYSNGIFSFHLHPKTNEYSTILWARKLLHEFIVDAWATIEQAWLCWVEWIMQHWKLMYTKVLYIQ